jgi:RNA polymerase sigma-70 factor (ECF subfamily)
LRVTSPGKSFASASPLFLTTRWSVIVRAQEGQSADAGAALESLCRAYWYPLYAWVRRQGQSAHDAQDLTQSFFARLLRKGYLHAADQQKGRFRTFLLIAFKRFLANEWDRATAQKRGGGSTPLSIDTAFAETRFAAELFHEQPADVEYDRRWALTLLDRSLATLRAEYTAAGHVAEFEALKEFLTAERGEIPYSTIAEVLGIGEGGARSAVHRLRKRFRQLFRAAIADTVSDPAEVDQEIRHVVRALGHA